MIQTELCTGNFFMKIDNATGTSESIDIVKNIRLYETGEGNEAAKPLMNI